MGLIYLKGIFIGGLSPFYIRLDSEFILLRTHPPSHFSSLQSVKSTLPAQDLQGLSESTLTQTQRSSESIKFGVIERIRRGNHQFQQISRRCRRFVKQVEQQSAESSSIQGVRRQETPSGVKCAPLKNEGFTKCLCLADLLAQDPSHPICKAQAADFYPRQEKKKS